MKTLIKSVKKKPARNPYVAPLHVKTGGGAHKDKRKEYSKKACRGKFDE